MKTAFDLNFILFIVSALLLPGCKPPASTAANDKSSAASISSDKPAAAMGLTDQASYPLLTGPSNALVNVGKRLMGLNPDSGDTQDHIGLATLAAMFGYDLPFNDCSASWLVRAGGTNDQPIIVITSDHTHGAGSKCGDPNQNAPVKYMFRAWQTAADNVTPTAWTTPPEPKDWPKPTASSNADTASAPVATLDATGKLMLHTQESVNGVANTRGEATTYHVLYERVIASAPDLSRDVTGEVGIQTAADDNGNAVFTVGSTPAKPRSTLLQCAVEVVEPAGCHYRVLLGIDYQQTRQHYRALLRVRPTMVGLAGRLRATGDCENRQYRGKDDSCGGAMGDDGKGVVDWFGHSGTDFATDMSNQANTDSGRWLWNNIRTLPLAQNQGISNLDWALRYFTQADYTKFALDFTATTETVAGCTLHVETLAGSASTCASMQDGASVVPTLNSRP